MNEPMFTECVRFGSKQAPMLTDARTARVIIEY